MTKKAEEIVYFNLRLPPKLHGDLAELARANRRSLHSEILTACEFWLEAAEEAAAQDLAEDLAAHSRPVNKSPKK